MASLVALLFLLDPSAGGVGAGVGGVRIARVVAWVARVSVCCSAAVTSGCTGAGRSVLGVMVMAVVSWLGPAVGWLVVLLFIVCVCSFTCFSLGSWGGSCG